MIGILVYNAIFLQIIINPNMSSFKEKRNQGGGKQNKKQKTENEKERKKRQLFTEANPNWLTKGWQTIWGRKKNRKNALLK